MIGGIRSDCLVMTSITEPIIVVNNDRGAFDRYENVGDPVDAVAGSLCVA